MRKIIIPFLFICSMSFGQMFSAQNAESGCPDVVIGSQTWQGCNLSVTKYNDGTPIPLVTDATAWETLSTPAYCWYNNDSVTYREYGALYNWHTVNTGKLCPLGYHVPDTTEYMTLANYLGGESVAGGKLKEAGTAHWNSPNTGATNEYGFTAIPSSMRNEKGTFIYYNTIGRFFISTNKTYSLAYNAMLYSTDEYLYIATTYKAYGLSVRCIKD